VSGNIPPIRKDMAGLLRDVLSRLLLVERRLAKSTTPGLVRGDTAQRNQTYPPPTTDAERVALHNAQVHWYNTSLQRMETYLALGSLPGLTYPGLAAGFASGWYAMPGTWWAGKSGPSSTIAAYKAGWARGVVGDGAALDALSDPGWIKIGMTGVYEIRSTMRGGPSGNAQYHALSLNGDRTNFENRSTIAPINGVWTHDHPGAANNFTESYYLGRMNAGDLVSAGPSATGTDIAVSLAASSGYLSVRRIS